MKLSKIAYCSWYFFLLIALTACGSSSDPLSYTMSGAVTGLNPGQQVTVVNNGADPQVITSNGNFTFNKRIPFHGSYTVTVSTQPSGQFCSVLNGTGTRVSSNVSNVNVVCGVTIIHSFNRDSKDGYDPQASLSLGSDGYLYGTTANGGANNKGTVFKINPADVASYQVIHSFGTLAGEGIEPTAGLIQAKDGYFYGTTDSGGAHNAGAIFKINPAGDSYVVLHSFTDLDGAQPNSKLALGNDGFLYGAALRGPNKNGVIFKINPADASSYQIVHAFEADTAKGKSPTGTLALGKDNYFFGTTFYGGTTETGTIFKLDPAKPTSSYQVLHSFTGPDGFYPIGGLVFKDNKFYGTTLSGANEHEHGTIFVFDPANTSHKIIHSFNGADGDAAATSLTAGSDGNLYGSTVLGGANDQGVLFRVDPNNPASYKVLLSFGDNNGALPQANLILGTDGHFYGTTREGGDNGRGTIFRY